jgi:hypothetical protein
MTDALTTEERVQRVIGGTFSYDSLGAGYHQTIAAVRADPAGHLRALEALFSSGALRADRIGELDPGALLKILMPIVPDETRRVARLVAAQLGQASRASEDAFDEADSPAVREDLMFHRQLLEDRRDQLARIIGRG